MGLCAEVVAAIEEKGARVPVNLLHNLWKGSGQDRRLISLGVSERQDGKKEGKWAGR